MNSMSLLRNSVIVGGATFLVGSALMEVSKGDEKVGWWPYAATFLSGALGYYVLHQSFVPESLELNAERIHGDERLDRWVENNYGDEYDWALLNEYGEYDEWDDAYDILEDFIVLDDDGNEHKGIAIIHREEYDAENESSSSLQSFSAEVFMADRKIRRRTRWTWTRGPEEGYADKDTVPYSDIYGYTTRKGRGWRSDYVPMYLIEDSYHISDLPEGYHLHLLKPNLRKDKWVAFAKSPSSDDGRNTKLTTNRKLPKTYSCGITKTSPSPKSLNCRLLTS